MSIPLSQQEFAYGGRSLSTAERELLGVVTPRDLQPFDVFVADGLTPPMQFGILSKDKYRAAQEVVEMIAPAVDEPDYPAAEVVIRITPRRKTS